MNSSIIKYIFFRIKYKYYDFKELNFILYIYCMGNEFIRVIFSIVNIYNN